MRVRCLTMALWGITAAVALPHQSRAAVDVAFQPTPLTVDRGVPFDLQLIATSDTGADESISAIDVVFTWDPTVFEFLGVVNTGPYSWLVSGFLPDPLNDSLDDGDAKFTTLSRFTGSAFAPPEGLLIATLQFRALISSDPTTIALVASTSTLPATQIFSALSANLIITGVLSDATVTVLPDNVLSLNVPLASQAVSVDDTFTVTLDLANLVQPITALQVFLQFDPSMLSLVDIAPNGLAGDFGSGWIELFESEVGGDISYGVGMVLDSTAADGNVATLTFTALAIGTTQINFDATPPQPIKLTGVDSVTIFPHLTGGGTPIVISAGACAFDSDCDDGDACNGSEICDVGACLPGVDVVCADDGNFCNGPEACDSATGACPSGPAPCLEDCCEDLNGCIPTNGCCADADCGDGDQCTQDVCSGGACENPNSFDASECCDPFDGSTILIDDADPCTDDLCDPGTGVVEHANTCPGTATFVGVGPTAVLPGTDVLFTVSVALPSGFDAADFVIGSNDATDLEFVYSDIWTSAFATVQEIAPDPGFYSQDLLAGGNNPTSVGTALIVGTLIVKTTGMPKGNYQVQIDPSIDGFSALALAGVWAPLAGSGNFMVQCASVDADCDGDVDLADYADFQSCLTGPSTARAALCDRHDLDRDGDVDMKDATLFMAQFTGGN